MARPPLGQLVKIRSRIRCAEGHLLYLSCGHHKAVDLVPDTGLARCPTCPAPGVPHTASDFAAWPDMRLDPTRAR